METMETMETDNVKYPTSYRFKSPPYGFQLAFVKGKAKRVVNVQEQAVTLHIVERRRDDGIGWRAIADELNMRGDLTRTGGIFTQSIVHEKYLVWEDLWSKNKNYCNRNPEVSYERWLQVRRRKQAENKQHERKITK